MDLLCADKTGTLTQNTLSVAACETFASFSVDEVMALAAIASSDGGADPVDGAIRKALTGGALENWVGVTFTPFDPTRKLAEATATNAAGGTVHVVKGSVEAVSSVAELSGPASLRVQAMQARGLRVIVVAYGAAEPLKIIGAIALSDPPRPDAAALVTRLRQLGVQVVMVTGDSAVTARVVADAVGLGGPVFSKMPLPQSVDPGSFSVFAGVLPEDKFNLVKLFQQKGHVVGMCGDGANDAPALRQAQIGIAVLTATDVREISGGSGSDRTGPGGRHRRRRRRKDRFSTDFDVHVSVDHSQGRPG